LVAVVHFRLLRLGRSSRASCAYRASMAAQPRFKLTHEPYLGRRSGGARPRAASETRERPSGAWGERRCEGRPEPVESLGWISSGTRDAPSERFRPPRTRPDWSGVTDLPSGVTSRADCLQVGIGEASRPSGHLFDIRQTRIRTCFAARSVTALSRR
jgi:hypothetical protein